jgi:hypothetical protein
VQIAVLSGGHQVVRRVWYAYSPYLDDAGQKSSWEKCRRDR